MGNDPNSGMTSLDLDGGLVGGTKPSKVTLADFRPRGGVLNVSSDSELVVILPGFHTCGAGCQNPRACLAVEQCARGIDPGSVEVTPAPTKALQQAALAMYSHAAAHTALGGVLKETGAMLEAEQYAKRGAAWQAYYAEHELHNRGHNSMVVAAIHDAFDAGWAARKKTEYDMAFGLDKPKAE